MSRLGKAAVETAAMTIKGNIANLRVAQILAAQTRAPIEWFFK
jgi:hypothetical protein